MLTIDLKPQDDISDQIPKRVGNLNISNILKAQKQTDKKPCTCLYFSNSFPFKSSKMLAEGKMKQGKCVSSQEMLK